MALFGGFFKKLGDKITGNQITDDFFDDLEEQLILADMGAPTAMRIIEELQTEVKRNKIKTVVTYNRNCL